MSRWELGFAAGGVEPWYSLSPPGRALGPLRRVAECAGKQVDVMLH